MVSRGLARDEGNCIWTLGIWPSEAVVQIDAGLQRRQEGRTVLLLLLLLLQFPFMGMERRCNVVAIETQEHLARRPSPSDFTAHLPES